jgi:hypothetical protein
MSLPKSESPSRKCQSQSERRTQLHMSNNSSKITKGWGINLTIILLEMFSRNYTLKSKYMSLNQMTANYILSKNSSPKKHFNWSHSQSNLMPSNNNHKLQMRNFYLWDKSMKIKSKSTILNSPHSNKHMTISKSNSRNHQNSFVFLLQKRVFWKSSRKNQKMKSRDSNQFNYPKPLSQSWK